MKTLKVLFTLICFMLVSVASQAANPLDGLTSTKEATIKYWSVDAKNRPIQLSAKLYYKDGEDIKFVCLNNHPTITHAEGAPSGKDPQMAAIKYMVTENALVICPDYAGFGETSQKVLHPYMCSTLTARNILDAYKAGVKWMKDQTYKKWEGIRQKTYNYKFDVNYYTVNVGYSQGGTNTLAFQRYLETEATEADRKLVNLAGSVCGAGVYDQQLVFDTYEQMEELDYPILMLYVLQGQLEAFGETIMRDLELSECFTPEFWQYCENGFHDKLNKQQINVDDLNKELKDNGFSTFYSIMNEAYRDRSSKVYRTIKKVLAQSNLLAEGWEPTAPIIFYHDRAGHDIVVPYAETTAAMARFAGHCKYVDAIDDYGYDGTGSGNWLSPTIIGENYLLHAAVFREEWNYDDQHPGQKTIMTGAAITGNTSYKFDQLDHRTFGARFYAQFIAECKNIRPNIAFADYFATVKGQGTAASQNIAPVETEVSTSYAPGQALAAGAYDRISISVPEVTVGEPVLVQFPAKVDGYIFGMDAERYLVSFDAEGQPVAYTAMDDTDDFEADQYYLVYPAQAAPAVVQSLTAGVRTNCSARAADAVMLNADVTPVYTIGDLSHLVDKLVAKQPNYRLEQVGKMQNGILEK